MSFTFEAMPRTLDTAMFKRDRMRGGDGPAGPSLVTGWIIDLPREATRVEKKWFEDNGFAFHARAPGEYRGGGEWKRPDDV